MNGDYTVRTTVTNSADGGTDYLEFTITLSGGTDVLDCLTEENLTVDTTYLNSIFTTSTPLVTGIIPGTHSTASFDASLVTTRVKTAAECGGRISNI